MHSRLPLFLATLVFGIVLASQGGPSVVQFTAATYEVDELDQYANIMLTRTPPVDDEVTVSLTVTEVLNGARLGSDYYVDSPTARVRFLRGLAKATYRIAVSSDLVTEPDESLLLTLDRPAAGCVLGPLTNAVLTFHDGAPVIGVFHSFWGDPSESSSMVVELSRWGRTNDPISVNFATTTNGTALPEIDFTPVRGTASFAPGQASPLEIRVPVFDHGRTGELKTIEFLLSSPSPNARLGKGNVLATIGDPKRRMLPANLDYSFNPPLTGVDRWQSPAIQTGGKIILAHAEDLEYASHLLLRLNGDGTYDPSFKLPPDVFNGVPAIISQIAAQPDDRLLVMGAFGPQCFCLIRLLPDGALDSSFETSLDVAHETYVQFHLLRDGKILVVITDPFNPEKFGLRLRRLNANGAGDESFREIRFDRIVRLVEEADGDILLLAEDAYPQRQLLRLKPDGSFDPSFNPQVTGDVFDILPLRSGGMLVRMENLPPTELRTRALKSDGSIDPSFRIENQNPSLRFHAEMDGKIYISFFESDHYLLARLEADGSLDRSFPATHLNNTAQGLDLTVLKHDDGLLLVGAPAVNGTRRPGLARLLLGNHPAQRFEWKNTSDLDAGDTAVGADEAAGLVTLTIRRLGQTDQPATVRFGTEDGTALAGVNYVATSGILNFAPGQFETAVSIPLIDDRIFFPKLFRSFSVWLDDPSGLAAIGSPAKLRIMDDDPGIFDLHRGADGKVTFWINHLRSLAPYPAAALEAVTVEFSDDLKSWAVLPLDETDPAFVTDKVPAQHPQRFYRARPISVR